MIFEALILNRAEAERKGYDVRVRILNKMMLYFRKSPRDLPGYTREIQSQMMNIMSQIHSFPNMPGVPYL